MKLHILLIEDCDMDAELAMKNLKQFIVTHAKTMKEGLRKLAMGEWDVVLLDLSLTNGDKSKDKLLARIRDARGKAATVVLTGDHNPQTRDLLLGLGVDGFMRKGVDDREPTDINYVLYQAIEHRQGAK